VPNAVLAKNSAGLATAATECKARKVVDAGKDDGRPFRPPNSHPQVLRAELVGADRCTAAGYVARALDIIAAIEAKAGAKP
jgi:hypothetical protein